MSEYQWTRRYIAFVVTLVAVLQVLELLRH
jgi:hypothetical protein